MLAVFRQRNFALLWLGFVVSMMGDWILLVALPFYIYQRTGSALATGAIFIVETLPALFFGSLAGVFVDRWNRRWTIIIAETMSAIVLLLLLFIQSSNGLWLVYVVAFLESLLEQFINSAYGAFVPNLLEEEQLTAGNSTYAFGQEMTRLIGPALGGVILSVFGLTNVIIVDSFSFLCCGVLVFFIAIPSKQKSVITPSASEIPMQTNVLKEWIEGLKLVQKEPIIRAVFIVMAVAMIGEGFGRVVFIPLVRDVLHGNSVTFGWTLSVQGLGGIIGSLLNSRLHKFVSSARIIAYSGMILGVLNLIAVTFPTVPVLLAIYLLGGGPVVIFFVGIYTLLQQNVPDTHQGRIFGAYSTTNMLFLLGGMFLCSTFTPILGSLLMFASMGVFYFLAGAVALVLLRKAKIVTEKYVVLDKSL